MNKFGTEYHRQWRAAHPNYRKGWKAKNPDYEKKRREKNREDYNRRMYAYGRANPEKTRARAAVYRAVRDGELVRPDFCSNCLVKCKPEADHRDYSKQLEVVWLCKSCHVRLTYQRKNATMTT